MKLQIAIDSGNSSYAKDVVNKIHDVVDIIEVGTPLIIREGLYTVKLLKEHFPSTNVLADTKIVDGGKIESTDACEAGADIITVLALAANETIKEVVEVAHNYGRKVMVDLISVKDIASRALELKELGVDYISVHTAVDVQKLGRTPMDDLIELLKVIPGDMCAVAGGINMDTIETYIAKKPEIIIVGGALLNAEDIREAAIKMKSKFNI